jgi:hypothetical protein
MPLSNRTLLLIAVSLLAIRILYAQTDPSGHWEGTISAPFGEAAIEVDLAKDAQGKLIGTLNSVAEKLSGLPLSNVTVDGNTVVFELRASTEAKKFEGTILDDGKSMAGDVGAATFSLTRTGSARIEAPPKSAAIRQELEGIWTGILEISPAQLHVTLEMSNQSDGTSMGTLSAAEEGLQVPVAIVQKDATLNVTIKNLNSSWSGTLNSAGTELTGTYRSSQGATMLLNFHRSGIN